MNKFYFLFGLSIISILIIGCQNNYFPLSFSDDKTLIDYSFIDYAYNCSVYSSANISVLSSINTSSYPSFMWYDSISANWSLLYCAFNGKCGLYSDSNVSLICANNVSGWVNLNTIFDDGQYKALCCNSNANSCYVDTELDIAIPSSVCDLNYTSLTTSLSFNVSSSLWDSICCVNGVTE